MNFAVFSSSADRIQLCLFDENDNETVCMDLPERTADVWHGFVPKLHPGQRYGYRVHGEFDPEQGRFQDPAKLLIDPYTKRLHGEFHWHDHVLTLNPGKDSGPFVPKSVVTASTKKSFQRPRVPWAETIFYETNVRGYTMRHPAVDETKRGTFTGLSNGQVIDHLRALGVTSIELLPIHAFIDERQLETRGLRNFWGYNSIAFFAPMNRYGISNPGEEFCDMVNALHDAGLEVILDVVYNHTGESDQHGTTLSFRGLDNTSYYRMDAHHPSHYINHTGCGNTINADHPAVQNLILDSLRYWHRDMGVDGFRFDLTTTLGRFNEGFSAEHPLLVAISNDAQLKGAKLVAEPWDASLDGYQLGQFPKGWSEWNDRFRDTARRFWSGDTSTVADFGRRLHGSADYFEASHRPPRSSINFITSHDGFNLWDLASYTSKHNEANGEENRDGHDANYSVNFGVEGPTDDSNIQAQRKRHRLNLLATLLVSQGTPLLLAGDEFGHTQQGNNNAYTGDNEMGWLDWDGIDRDPGFVQAVQKLLQIRRDTPLLRLNDYVHGPLERNGKVVELTWLNADGEKRSDQDWNTNRPFTLCISSADQEQLRDAVAICLNPSDEDASFALPFSDASWQLRFCSADGLGNMSGDNEFWLPANSLSILCR